MTHTFKKLLPDCALSIHDAQPHHDVAPMLPGSGRFFQRAFLFNLFLPVDERAGFQLCYREVSGQRKDRVVHAGEQTGGRGL